MFTNRAAQWFSTRRSAKVGAALILSVLAVSSAAYAGSVINLNCIGGGGSFNCVAQWATAGDPYVRVVPEPLGEAQKAQVAARERKWLAQCHPVIERDRLGVPRYRYSAPGCEFGLGMD